MYVNRLSNNRPEDRQQLLQWFVQYLEHLLNHKQVFDLGVLKLSQE